MNLKTKQSHGWVDMHYTMWLFVFAVSLWAVRSLKCPLTPLCPGTPTVSGITARMRTMSAMPGNW